MMFFIRIASMYFTLASVVIIVFADINNIISSSSNKTYENVVPIEKRKSVRDFLDSLIDGRSNTPIIRDSATTASPAPSPTPAPHMQPIAIHLPFPLSQMSMPPPPPLMPPPPPPMYGYPNRGPPPMHDHHHHNHPHHHNHHNHHHNHHNHHHPPIHRPIGYHSMLPFNPPGQSSHPIAIAIPFPPLSNVIPVHFDPHHENQGSSHRFLGPPSRDYFTDREYGNSMSGSTRYALFADPFEADSEEDLFENTRAVWI